MCTFLRSLGAATLRLALCSVAALAQPHAAHAAGFSYRKAVTIDRTKVGVSGTATTALSNFPMLYSVTDASLKSTSNGGHVNSTSGYDIVFRALDTGTCGGAAVCTLSHEVEQYTASTGQLIAWTRVPSLKAYGASSNTVIYVYYGNASITSSTERKTDVWDSSFKGVWHFNDSASPAKDSTSGGTDLATTGSGVTYSAAGQVANALQMDGSTGGDGVTSTSTAYQPGTNAITYSIWFRLAGYTGASALIQALNYNSGSYYGIQLEPGSSSSNAAFWWRYGNGQSGDNTANATTATNSLNQWIHAAVTQNNSSTVVMYKNGASISVTNPTNSTVGFTGVTDVYVGAYSGGGTAILNGKVDEARLSNVARSADWIATEYNGTNSPSTFVSTAAEVSNPPTAIRLRDFAAWRRSGGVALAWSTGHEVDNLGFHVYREASDRRVRLTPSLIAGSALFAGAGTPLSAGMSYSWVDDSAPKDGTRSRYWLEEVNLGGRSTWHGPMSPKAGPAKGIELASDPAVTRSALLSSAGRGRPDDFHIQERRLAARPAAAASQALDTQPRRLRLKVREEGWYKVSNADLATAGLPVDPGSLRLEAEGEEQAILPTADGIEFYGLGVDTPWTDLRAYFLSSAGAGQEPARIARASAGNGVAPTGEPAFPVTLERRDRSIYFAALRNGDEENFFGPIVGAQPADLPVAIQYLADDSAAAPPGLQVVLQGVSAGAHGVDVAVDGMGLATMTFQGQERGSLELDLPPGLLHEGANTVTLTPQGVEDVSLVDFVRVRYQRRYRAANDVLRFPLPRGRAITVRGFTRRDVRAVDVSNPSFPVELEGVVAPDGTTFALTLALAGGASDVLAFTGGQVKTPISIEDRPSFRPGASSDMVVVVPQPLRVALQPLIDKRRSEGLAVEVVDPEDIYDHFSFGRKSPFSLRLFLEAANKERGAKFALLVGDASFDPRNHLGQGDFDLVPTKLVDTRLLETASDDWLADFDVDGLPDMALGRLPVRTALEAATVAEKIARYQAPESSAVLVVSGKSDGIDFASAGRGLLAWLPPAIESRQIDAGLLGDGRAREDLLSALQDGAHVVAYVGHGSTGVWANGLFERADVDRTVAARPAVFVPLTCLNGFFQDVYTESLGESLLKAPHGGAVAVWASSGLTEPDVQAPLGQIFLQALLTGPSRLGEAAVRAKTKVADDDIRRTWTLLGDPSMRIAIAPPAAPPPVETAKNEAAGCACSLSRRAAPVVALISLFGLVLGGLAVVRGVARSRGPGPPNRRHPSS